MDLIKKTFARKQRAEKKKKEKLFNKKTNKKEKKKNKKKEKKKKRNSRSRDSSSSEESSSDESNRALKIAVSKFAVDTANIDKKYRMAGALVKKPEDPPNFARKVLEAEWRDMQMDAKVTNETVKTLDSYLKNRAELRSTDHVVIAEKVDDDDKKKTTRLKILTKYDEGRFGAVYMVQNESAIDNDVISIGNARFMMKTALRQLSSHQIVYRLSTEINALKMLWSKGNDQPPRIPPILHLGKILGVPFYVTSIYDVNLEKCREQMGGGEFSVGSALHIAQEIFLALQFLHRRRVVHRDIKPTNVVLSYQNRDQWYLIDYGDIVPVGRNIQLSPPDGLTLPFLSLEAHELLVSSIPTTFQQDLESWFFLMVDLIKPLPWREQNKIEKVALSKREFLSNLASRTSELPSHVIEIWNVIKTDAAPYPEISKKLADGLAEVKRSKEACSPEWYDRAATKLMRAQKTNDRRRSKEREKETTCHMEATGKLILSAEKVAEPTINDKRDRSVYVSERAVVFPAVATTGDQKASTPTDQQGVCLNKMAAIVEEEPKKKQQDPSVYFADFPIATSPNVGVGVGGKKKYRYKPKR